MVLGVSVMHLERRGLHEIPVLPAYPKISPREFWAIRTERGGWTPYDAVAEREKEILLDELVAGHDGLTVTVTDHPLLAECGDAYRTRAAPWWTCALYTSDLLTTVPEQFQPHLWMDMAPYSFALRHSPRSD